MPIFWVLIVIVAVGVGVTLLHTHVPDDILSPLWKKLISAVAVIAVILWLISIYAPGLTVWHGH